MSHKLERAQRKIRFFGLAGQTQHECLESRYLLTGNVTAVVSRGDLIVEGDSQANYIRLESTNTAGEYRITGISTTVNGLTDVILSGVTDDMIFRMGDGDDRFDLVAGGEHNFLVPDDLNVDLGGGGNTVFLQAMNSAQILVGGNLTIVGGELDDNIAIEALGANCVVDIAGNLKLDMGRGQCIATVVATGENSSVSVHGTTRMIAREDNDAFLFGALGLNSKLQFDGKLIVEAGQGNNQLAVQAAGTGSPFVANSSVIYSGKDGNDSVSLQGGIDIGDAFKASLGGGQNYCDIEVNAENSVLRIGGDVTINAKNGNDSFRWLSTGENSDTVFDGGLDVRLGHGRNQAFVQTTGVNAALSIAGDATLTGGNGVDEFNLQQLTGNALEFNRKLKVSLLGENDILRITGLNVANAADFDGGSGTNTLTDGGENVFAETPTFMGF